MVPILTTRDLMMLSRETIRKRRMMILLMAALFIGLQLIVSVLQGQLSGYSDYALAVSDKATEYAKQYQEAETPEAREELMNELYDNLPTYKLPNTVSLLLALVVTLLSSLLSAGYQYHTLLESRGVATDYRSLFYGMNHPVKVLIIQLLTSILVTLGMMLFLVPGVILSLRYSCALLVLYDNPSYGPIQCMKESARIMKGNKMDLFKLELAFIPWQLLSTFATLLVGVPLLDIWVYPYYFISRGIFYSRLTVGSWHAGLEHEEPTTRDDDYDDFDDFDDDF